MVAGFLFMFTTGVLSLVGFTKVVFPKLFSLNGDRQAFANEYHSALNNVF